MSIAENIKTLRKANKLSQTDFGKIAGVTDKAVSTWESGEKIPRMGAIQKLADHFGISKSDIIEDKLPKHLTNDSNSVVLLPDETQLLNLYRNFNDKGKEKARERLSEMAQLEQYQKVVYRAARSRNNTEHEIIKDTNGTIDKLKQIPPVTDKEDF